MPAPVVIFTAPSPTTEDMFPAPTDVYAAPAPVIKHVGACTCDWVHRTSTTSDHFYALQQFPAYTMAAVITGVNLDTTSLELIVAEQESVQQHTAEQIVHVPTPQIWEAD